MSERKQVYNVMIPEKYVGGDKVERTSYYQVGTAFETKDGGGMRIKLAPNITVSGELLVLPRKARAEDDGTQGQEE